MRCGGTSGATVAAIRTLLPTGALSVSHSSKSTRMDTASILKQLDEAARGFVFPMLDNGYVYPADVRLTVYRDSRDWLMIIEVLGAFTAKVSGRDSFQNSLHLFGSAIHQKPGMVDASLFPVESLEDDPLFEDEYEWNLRPEARSLCIRGSAVIFDPSPESLAKKGIELLDPPSIDPPAVLRSLLPEHRNALLASEDELAAHNPKHLPLWLRLDEWNHPDLAGDVMPSDSETFRMLADAIVAGDTSLYAPMLPPNTHWKYWPEGGTL
jgi:hypothetical protein